MISEIIQAEKDKCHIILLICKEIDLVEVENRMWLPEIRTERIRETRQVDQQIPSHC